MVILTKAKISCCVKNGNFKCKQDALFSQKVGASSGETMKHNW
jgi:hypothetical protein